MSKEAADGVRQALQDARMARVAAEEKILGAIRELIGEFSDDQIRRILAHIRSGGDVQLDCLGGPARNTSDWHNQPGVQIGDHNTQVNTFK